MTYSGSFALPPVDQQISRLAATGYQFNPEDRLHWREPLGGVYIGDELALYDKHIVSHIPTMIAPAAEVQEALYAVRPAASTTMSDGGRAIDTLMSSEGLIVGFSGYGTGDYPYQLEHDVMQEMFGYWGHEDMAVPVSSVIDGGTGYGVPGLSGTLAAKYGFQTTGFVPVRGLRGVAPRDTCMVVGQEFGDEAQALGTAPDVLFVLGGGPNAEKEVLASLAAGSLVIPLVLKMYPENSVAYLAQRNKDVAEASVCGQFRHCNDVLSAVLMVEDLDMDRVMEAREIRKLYLSSLLSRQHDA